MFSGVLCLHVQRLPGPVLYFLFQKRMRICLLFLLSFPVLSGCEAPLVLDGVNESKQSSIRRTDVFMGAADNGEKSVIVGSGGVIVSAKSGAGDWHRTQLDGRPVLIDITVCQNDGFAALSMEGQVWTSDREARQWTQHQLPTPEIPQAITCDNKGAIWVAGSFISIFSSRDGGESWTDHSLNEDMIMSTVQFVDDLKGFITGEFGTVLVTRDGGETWEFSEPIPKEFFPLAGIFKDAKTGWVVGLNGTIYSTKDGALSWQQEEINVRAPLFGVSIINDQIIAVGDYGTVIHRSINDAGSNWEILEIPIQSHFFFRVSLPLKNNKMILAGSAGSLRLIDLAQINLSKAETN